MFRLKILITFLLVMPSKINADDLISMTTDDFYNAPKDKDGRFFNVKDIEKLEQITIASKSVEKSIKGDVWNKKVEYILLVNLVRVDQPFEYLHRRDMTVQSLDVNIPSSTMIIKVTTDAKRFRTLLKKRYVSQFATVSYWTGKRKSETAKFHDRAILPRIPMCT